MTGEDRARAAASCAAGQGVEERPQGASRYREDVFDAELLEVFHNQIAEGHKKPPIQKK
jgi:hypothetical protein